MLTIHYLCKRLFDIEFKISLLWIFSILAVNHSALVLSLVPGFWNCFCPGLPVLDLTSPVLYSYPSNVLVCLVFPSYPWSTSWSLLYWSPVHDFSYCVPPLYMSKPPQSLCFHEPYNFFSLGQVLYFILLLFFLVLKFS
jgi:hypothetical protein